MSIADEINFLCSAGRVHRFVPMFAAPKERRVTYVSSDIQALLIDSWSGKAQESRWGYVRADLESFVRDPWITVAADSRRAGPAYMAQLQPPSDETWDIRCRDPQPGIRLLGRFALKDVFIALTWEERLPLKDFGSTEWKEAIARCVVEWNRRFWNQPLTGSYPDGYLSGAILQ
jgi:hypothetical protein